MLDDEQPGRPNSAGDSALGMLTIGTILVLVLLFVPPSLRARAFGSGDDLGTSVLDWLTTLYASPGALASVISAFAVLMLALFIEESLKASDKVAVGTRRNIATFAFIGGIATVVIAGIAIAGVSIGMDAGAAIQIAGSASVVLFFASHIATRSVTSLKKQKQNLADAASNLATAIAAINLRNTMSDRVARWTLGTLGALCWVILPVTGFFLAAVVDPDRAGGWVGGLLGVAYLSTLAFFATWATTPGYAKVVVVLAHIGWWILVVFLVFAVLVAFSVNTSENPVLPILVMVTPVLTLVTAPFALMPSWTITAAALRLQQRSLTKSQAANTEATRKLQEYEEALAQTSPTSCCATHQ
ncbi:hypothetical protein ACFY9N_03965 [Microbacterium sp. NPDC008134]|uniref:hypothetical protein n=1 Tax=Microbacterium sp. NPDC008134 TaxID=3364183 RepID=UPI0036EC64B0